MKGRREGRSYSFNELEGFFCGHEEKEDLEVHSLCIFWTVWKEKNRIAFRDETLVV